MSAFRTASKSGIEAILNGDLTQINTAFIWQETSQGVDHWHDIVYGGKELTDEDRAYLEQLAKEARCV